jgi:hypothetical protein
MPSQQLEQAELYSIYRISYYSLDQAANAKSAAGAGKIILYIQNTENSASRKLNALCQQLLNPQSTPIFLVTFSFAYSAFRFMCSPEATSI